MKTLAILGGMTPDVTSLYYRLINSYIRQKLGQRRSARLYIYSVDLEAQLQRAERGEWDAFAMEYVDALQPLINLPLDASGRPPAAVRGVIISAILAHKVTTQIQAALPNDVQLLHIADFVAQELKTKQIKVVGLIGPSITIQDHSPDFFIGKLITDHGLQVLTPVEEAERDEINRGMLEEVVKGRDAVTTSTAEMFRAAARKLIQRGAQGLILGSTDLGFVLSQADFDIPVLDAAEVHTRGVAAWSLERDI